MNQIIDTESAKEFMKETLAKISADELSNICIALENKSQWFQTHLQKNNLATLSVEQISALLHTIFSTRRKVQKMLDSCSVAEMRVWIYDLLYGAEPVENRFKIFCDNLDFVEQNIRCDLAGELLHFTFPNKYWLWSRWMWDPRTKTGALPLVVTSNYSLAGASLGENYLLVGKAVAFIHQVGEAAGFLAVSHTLFGTDVYLSCVYIVYVYTVLRLRMTQEFNKVMPGLSEFSKRLLGVHNKTNPESQ